MATSTEPVKGGYASRIAELKTEYFEIDSDIVGGRFAVSVSLPAAGYGNESLPVVYTLDSQWHGGGYEKLHDALTKPEAARKVQPYVQVNIGYTIEDGDEAIGIRNRDLVLNGEGYPAGFAEYLADHLGRDGVQASPEKLERFFGYLSHARPDRFLAFLETELHPLIAARYDVKSEDAGVFGFSYGGLFALYALVADSALFTRFGAGSPGILVENSNIFPAYEEFAARTDRRDHERRLHITVADNEMFGPIKLYRLLGIETARFYDLVCSQPVPGLDVTTEVILGEDHESGTFDAYRSFIRTCYAI
ncbi:MAG: alpha/beta hydrolase-fold protein [Microbacterium sp.]